MTSLLALIAGLITGTLVQVNMYWEVEWCWDKTFMWFWYNKKRLKCFQFGWLVINLSRRPL